MQEINFSGNLFLLPGDPTKEAAVVTTNGIIKSNGRLVMGRGIAGYSAARHAGIDVLLAEHVRANGNVPCDAGTYDDSERAAAGLPSAVRVLSLPTKDHWKDPSSLSLIVGGCRKLVAMADALGLERVYLPMPGCTNGRLSYGKDVRAAIAAVLDDRFVVMVPDLDALPNPEGQVFLSGYDKDDGRYDVLSTSAQWPTALGWIAHAMDLPAKSILSYPDYDWYEIQSAGSDRAAVVDGTGRVCPSQPR